MGLRQTPVEKKYLAAARAKLRLKQTFERIDFEDALLDELHALREQGALVDVVIEPIEIDKK